MAEPGETVGLAALVDAACAWHALPLRDRILIRWRQHQQGIFTLSKFVGEAIYEAKWTMPGYSSYRRLKKLWQRYLGKVW